MDADDKIHIFRPLAEGDNGQDAQCSRRASVLCSRHGRPPPVEKRQGDTNPGPRRSTHEFAANSEPREAHVRAPGTAEIAFFLKHTGPPLCKTSTVTLPARSPPRVKRRSGLTMFKRRRSLATTTKRSPPRNAQANDQALRPYSLVKKTLPNGSTYFHITPNAETAQRLFAKASQKSLRHSQRPPRISDTFVERSVLTETDILDKWLTGDVLDHNEDQALPFDDLSRTAEIARASSRLLGSDERFCSLRQLSKPETSWRPDLMSQHPQDEQQQIASPVPQDGQADTSSHYGTNIGAEQDSQQLSPCTYLPDTEAEDVRDETALTPSTSAVPEDDGNIWQMETQHPVIEMDNALRGQQRYGFSEDRKDSFDCPQQSRELSTRAKKLRDLRQARPHKKTSESIKTSTSPREGEETTLQSSNNVTRPCRTVKHAAFARAYSPSSDDSPLEPSPEILTNGTSRSSKSSLSPVMLIAEQFPMPRTKQYRRPTPLLLPARQASEQLAIAVRENILETIKKSTEARVSNAAAHVRAPATAGGSSLSLVSNTQDHSPSALPHADLSSSREKQQQRQPPAAHSASLPADPHLSAALALSPSAAERAESPTPQPAKASSAAAPESHDAALPGLPARSPYRLLAQTIPSQLQRCSISSTFAAGGSKEARLEARVELLERENKLLEAALMAVLKTGGRLNGCPCREGGCGEAEQVVAAAVDGAHSTLGDEDGAAAGQRGARAAHDAGEARKSPLSLYLDTRAHGFRGEG